MTVRDPRRRYRTHPPPHQSASEAAKDRGSTTVEFVIAAAVMVLLLLVIVQVGLYFHLRAVAQTAARHGVDEVRVLDGSTDQGIAAATGFLDQGGQSLRDRSVTAQRSAASSSVTVSGSVVSVIPGITLTVDVTASAPTERIVP